MKVICLGEILFDYIANQTGGTLEIVQSWTPFAGGAPANVACALSRLGTQTAFVGCVGEDEAGKQLISLCEERGVNCTGVQYHKIAPTRQVYVLRSEEGDRNFAGFGDRSPEEFADAYLQAQFPKSLFEQAEYLVIGTIPLAYSQSRNALLQALHWADDYHLKIVLDVNWRQKFWPNPEEAMEQIAKLWNWVDFLKVSVQEAEWLFNTSDVREIAQQLDGLEGIIITAGGEGAISYSLSDQIGQVSPFSVPVQDTTGAGDSFLAGFLHQLCQKGVSALQDPETAAEMIRYAAAVGALSSMGLGAIASQPTPQQVQEFLAYSESPTY